MPLYEFACTRCEKTFTETQTISDHDKVMPPCPQCHSAQHVKHQITDINVQTPRKSVRTG